MTEDDVVTAVSAALTTTNAAPYTLGDLARLTVPPAFYNEVTVTPMFVAANDAAGMPVVGAWRITTRAVAKTEGNAREMRRRATVGLQGVRIATGATPVLFESADPIAEDDGWYSGLSTWTFSS